MKASALGPITVVIIPYLIFEYLRHSPYDASIHAPYSHFYLVSATALLATFMGIAAGIAGSRLRNIQVSFLSLAFISLAGVFTLHGLTTPGFLHDVIKLPGIAAQVSILLASVWLWLSALSSDHVLVQFFARWKGRLVPVWTMILTALCVLILLFPAVTNFFAPMTQKTPALVITMVVILLNSYTIYSYFISYRYSKFPLQIAIVYSAGWFVVSQIIMVLGEVWKISWWLYHFLLLASMVAMVWGLYKQYGSSKSLVKTIQALYTTDPVERLTGFLSPSVKKLILEVESKDNYTAGHNFRVTIYALRIAEEMGLSPEQRRALVIGTILHDVGKIKIPNEVLNKPGKLTKEERAMIEQHPVIGYEICKNLGFMKEELSIIRSHHERMDGKGYPDGIKGEDIPQLARIVALADVYDALTSQRAYRQAWSHEETMDYLEAQKGTHFDPDCVDAWRRVCERDSRVYREIHHGLSLFVTNEKRRFDFSTID